MSENSTHTRTPRPFLGKMFEILTLTGIAVVVIASIVMPLLGNVRIGYGSVGVGLGLITLGTIFLAAGSRPEKRVGVILMGILFAFITTGFLLRTFA